jgi:hypothetical protein
MKLHSAVACGVVFGLSSGCEVPPRLSPTLKKVSDAAYGVGFERCSEQWPLQVSEITVFRLEGDHDASECKLSYSYADDRFEQLESSAVWTYGTPVPKYQLTGDCAPIQRGSRYRIEVNHVTVAPIERSIVEVDAAGGVRVVERSCDAYE